MTIQAALLDEQDIYIGMATLESEAELTDRHIASITACDLPVGQYRWVPEAGNPYGGQFVSLVAIQRAAELAEQQRMQQLQQRGR